MTGPANVGSANDLQFFATHVRAEGLPLESNAPILMERLKAVLSVHQLTDPVIGVRFTIGPRQRQNSAAWRPAIELPLRKGLSPATILDAVAPDAARRDVCFPVQVL